MGLTIDVTRNILVCGSSWRKESQRKRGIRLEEQPTFPFHDHRHLPIGYSLFVFWYINGVIWHRTSFSVSLLFHQLQKNLLWTISYSSPSICLLATTQLSSQVFISWLKCYDYFKICLYSCKNYSQHWLPFLFTDVEFESSSDSGLSVESSEISSELAVFPHHVIGFFLPLGSVELVPIQLPSYPSSESISSYHQVQTKHRLIKWSLPPPSTPSVLLPGWNAMP